MSDLTPGSGTTVVAPATDAAADTGAGAVEAGPTLRFTCLDGLRILGMFGVLSVHAAFVTGADQKHFGQLLSNGQIAVPMFMAISGFLMFRPLFLRHLIGKPQGSARTRLRRRFVRVLPGYWFILTFCVVFLGVELKGLKNAFLYYSLLFPFARTDVALGFGGKAGIPDAWFLTADLVFTMLLPLFTLAVIASTRRATTEQKIRTALVACVGVYLFAQVFRALVIVWEPSWARRELIWPTNWVDFFAIGLALAALSAWNATSGRMLRPVDWLSRHPATSWFFAACLYVGLLLIPPPRVPGALTAEYWTRFLVWGFFVFFVVVPAVFGDPKHGLGRRMLSSRVAVFGGTISYGFYLYHKAVLNKVQPKLGYAPFSGGFLPIYIVTAAIAIVLAAFTYYVAERPLLKLKDQPLADLVKSFWIRHPKESAPSVRTADAPR